ncbi:uncharacterized protein LOC111123565 isoform X1 [Crassostrea virginica]
MPKRRVEWYPQAVASTGRQRQTGTPVAPAQPEPKKDRPLPTNVDHTHPTRPASDDQMFNELQLKQLTDAIAAAQPEPIEDRPLSTNVDHTQPTTPAYDDQMFNELQLRQLTDAIAATQPEPIEDRPLPTNVDHTHPTRPASDDQMFNELQLKQLTDAIAAAQPEPIEDRPLSTNVDHTQPSTPANDDQMFNELQLRQLTDAIAAAQPEPIEDRPLSTNVDHTQPSTPANDDQMFNELQLRQLTDAIAACMNTDPIPDRTTDFGSTNDDMMQPLETSAIMGFFSSIGRLVIVILNVVFVIVSVVLLAAGIALKFLKDNAFIKDAEDQIKASLKAMLESTGNSNVDLGNFSLSGVFGTAAVCLIAIGAFLLVVAFCGCCGACYKFQTLLVIYAGILVFLLVGEFSLIIVLYASPAVKNMVKDELTVSLNDYQGLTGTNVESLLWNGVMREFQCCGVVDYKDFARVAKKWDNTPDIGGAATAALETPIACCVEIPTSATSVSCATGTLDASTNNFNKGCFDKIWDKIFEDPAMLGIVLTIAFSVQILLIVFTILMYRENKGNQVNPS